MQPLTNEERDKIAAMMRENTGLVFFVVNRIKRRRPWLDLEELEQSALVGMMRAARTFNPDRGPLSTLAVMCMHHEITRELKRQAGRIVCERLAFEENVPAREDTTITQAEEQESAVSEVECLLGTLDGRTREIVKAHFGIQRQSGLTQTEIASRLELSANRISQIVLHGLRHMRKEAGHEHG